MLKAYADEHVQSAIVESLRKRGLDVVTVQERGRHATNDATLLALALEEKRILLTNDHDFLKLASVFSDQGEAFAPIFYWPQQRRSVGEVVRSVIRECATSDYRSACSRVYYL